jgi:hypothetical protein
VLQGWAGGVISTVYFAHVPLLIFWWAYGLRRVPWRCLVAATCVTLGISVAWEIFGRTMVGLEFTTDNSSAIGASLHGWLEGLRRPLSEIAVYVRGGTLRDGPVASVIAIRGIVFSAFPYPWWALAGLGFIVSSPQDRSWALAFVMAGLVPAIVILSLLPLPRAAFYMYPAVYVMAARGALRLGRVAGGAALFTLALVSNADLFGVHVFITRFHESMGSSW